jgi:transposase
MVCAGLKEAVEFILSPGNSHDAPVGRDLLECVGYQKQVKPLLMDRAYEDDQTRNLAASLGFQVVVPPKKNRLNPWDYDKELYRRRNEVERLFRLIQGFRRVFCRFDKLDTVYLGFIKIALIFIAIR